MIQEVFVENAWDDEGTAQRQRDERYEELVAAGLECRRENLYRVDGRRVFLVVATPVEEEILPSISPSPRREKTVISPRLRSQRPVRRVQGYETR